MALLTDNEIKEAIKTKGIEIAPFDGEHCLQPASYDLRVGKRAIITKSMGLEELKKKVEKEESTEIDVEKAGSMTVPAGGFALVTTLEKIKFSNLYAGHIGMRSFFTRKGLSILSGLQIDPGFEGTLVLGLCNLSPRQLTLDYEDRIATIEIHKLNKATAKPYIGKYTEEQMEGKIPQQDKYYLRTIETMSMSDLTKSLLTLSGNIDKLSKQFWYFWIPLIIAIIVGIIVMLWG
ncbi:dCTP deaminase [Candidatus Woesearchaeota archaeon]|nr:dCTP deaminase [Candidatus Woesearchaeota archaeon]